MYMTFPRAPLLAVLCTFLLFAGCTDLLQGPSRGSSGPSGSSASSGSSFLPALPAGDFAEGAPQPESFSPGQASSADVSGTSLQTKEATVSIEVKHGELESKLNEAKAILRARNADTVSILYDEYGYRKTYSLTFRILPSQFDETLEALKGIGEVKSVNLALEDVTREYTDLNIRLTNQRTELERLYTLYNRSENVSDLLAVENEITRVTAEIEQLESDRQALETRVAKSKITLELYAPATPEATEADLTLKINEGQLESKLQALKTITATENGSADSVQFAESSTEKRYFVTIHMAPSHLQNVLDAVRTLGELENMNTHIDQENRPEKSRVSVTLVEQKPALQTNLFAPLETVVGTFFAALSTGIILLAGLAGFLLPLAILVWVAYLLYKRVRKK